MSKKILLLLTLGLALAVLALLIIRIPDKKKDPFIVGKLIPEFRFKDINGNDYFFNDFKGKVVLIDHWATWCQYCLVELPHLEKLRNEYDREDLEIVTLLHDPENLDLAKDIIQRNQLTLPVLLRDDNPVFSAVEADGLPYSILLDRKGIIRFVHRGFTPADVAKYENELKYLLDEK